MKILVCISNTPDTVTKVKFSPDGKNFVEEGVQWIINPWDELALSRAVELKELHPTLFESVTVLTVGDAGAEPTMRKALAIGADDGIRIDTQPMDSYQVAAQLAEVAKNYDVVFCGIESSDYQGGGSGQMLAEMIGYESVTGVSALDIESDQLLVSREVQGGKERLQVETPIVVVVQKGIAHVPRIASIRGIMAARRKQIEVKEGINVDAMVTYTHFELPPPKQECQFFEADQTDELLDKLQQEAKVLSLKKS